MKNFIILINYGNWLIQVLDKNENLVTDLTRTNNPSETKYFGKGLVNNSLIEICEHSDKISITHNVINELGSIEFIKTNGFARTAKIKLENNSFVFTRKDLAQEFMLEDDKHNIIASINGKLRKDKDANILGIIYFPKSLYHAVALNTENINIDKALELLLICGFCARKFQQIDSGDAY
ncbi:MAG: hypothetical protein V4677_12610 [Bacteroidota bacterium]